MATRITFICPMTFNSFPLDVQVCLFQVHQITLVKFSVVKISKNLKEQGKTSSNPFLNTIHGFQTPASLGYMFRYRIYQGIWWNVTSILISVWWIIWMVSGWFVQLRQHKNGLQWFLHRRGGSHQVFHQILCSFS